MFIKKYPNEHYFTFKAFEINFNRDVKRYLAYDWIFVELDTQFLIFKLLIGISVRWSR